MDSLLSDKEREVAAEVSARAMMSGWDTAIGWAARQFGVSQMDIRVILDKASRHNDSADPSMRIDELVDWNREKRGRSERSQESRLHRLSPGLRKYMEDKRRAKVTASSPD